MLSSSNVMGCRRVEESMAMLWPWLARMSQFEDGVVVVEAEGRGDGLVVA